MNSLADLIYKFVHYVNVNNVDIYNEFCLQHELGSFLRERLPEYKVQFERNISKFTDNKNFTKRELDISVFNDDLSDLKYAIELKCPKNGQYPEQMFSFCKDIAFSEELKAIGFTQTGVLIFADDPLFYSGSGDNIYSYFRAGKLLTGEILKPTGNKKDKVNIKGEYLVSWLPVSGSTKFSFIEVVSAE